jgi:hypothetical protein
MIPVAEAAQRSRKGKLLWTTISPLPFDLPAVARKKVSAAFDGGRITTDGGVMLLAQAERRLGIADQLARVIPDESGMRTGSSTFPTSSFLAVAPAFDESPGDWFSGH